MTNRHDNLTNTEKRLPIGTVINRLAHEFRSQTAAKVEKELGIPLRGLGLMIRVSLEPGCNQVTCAKDIGMDLSTFGRLVDLLCDASILERKPIPGDRRAHALYLTAKGEMFVKDGREMVDEVEACLLANLSAKEVQMLFQLLAKAVSLDT